MSDPATEPREWRPSRAVLWAWNGLAGPLAAATLLGFAWFASALGIPLVRPDGGWWAPLTFAGLFALMAVHEGVHGLAILALGRRPRFGAKLLGRACPVLYCSWSGEPMPLAHYLAAALAPLFVLTGLGLLCVAAAPALVLPIGLLAAGQAAGCVGDMWLSGIALAQPRGTRFEDLEDGVRLVPPGRAAGA